MADILVESRQVVNNDEQSEDTPQDGAQAMVSDLQNLSIAPPSNSLENTNFPQDETTKYKNTVSKNMTIKNTKLTYPRSTNPNMSVTDRVASEHIDVRVSKAMAAGLRHGKMNFEVDQEGFMWVDDILDHPYFKKLNVTFGDLKRICDNPFDGIKRFYLSRDSTGYWKVRATQGHTIQVKNLDLIPISMFDTMQMPFVIHGTFWKAWEKIKNNGLKLMLQRQYLHFQPGGMGTNMKDLVANFRNNCEVLVYVDLAKALEHGIPFWRAMNNVIVTHGDQYNRISSRYFLKAVHISPTTGEQIWIETLGNEDCIAGDNVIQGLERSEIKACTKINEEVKKRGPNPHPSRSRQASASTTQFSTASNASRSRQPSVNN